ncbi:hypothetical protein ABZW02_31120 [Streptomyces sp. NPDC005180]
MTVAYGSLQRRRLTRRRRHCRRKRYSDVTGIRAGFGTSARWPSLAST